MIKNFLNNLLLSILQRIPYVQKLEAERDKAIAEKEQLELMNLGIEYEDTDVPRGKRNVWSRLVYPDTSDRLFLNIHVRCNPNSSTQY